MDEETQVAPEASTTSDGTSDSGQSNQPEDSANKPNDPAFMQADYTRKTMALAEERRALEADRANFERTKYQTPAYTQPAQPHVDTSQQSYNSLVEQFGQSGADAILKQQQLTQQQLHQFRFESLYSQEELKGRYKYGEENWNKHTYMDPRTGQMRNKVMDYRVMVNPLTGVSMTLDEAWRAANPVDPEKIAKETKEAAYKEMQAKASSTPAKAGGAPSGAPAQRAMTVSEAYAMALKEIG
jgi:hypothetical protein